MSGQDHSAPPAPWPADKFTIRREDMGRGSLRLVLDHDNDVCVAVMDDDGNVSVVEFCNPGGGGGGRSPKTRMALIALMVAIEADNAERPIPLTGPKVVP
jgi:hypothetical protein